MPKAASLEARILMIRYDASAVVEVCSGADIHVRIKDRPGGKETDVLEYALLNDEITLRWIDGKHLDVTVPEADSVGYEAVKLKDVTISYHFGKIIEP